MKVHKSLVECLEKIEDPRADYGVKHNFIDILTIAILSVISGADTWNDMQDWGYAKIEWLKTFLELPNGIPSHDTFNRIFAAIDSTQFHNAFIEWVQAITDKIEGVVAIDGKTVRRSKDVANGKKAIHVVSAWAAEHSLVLGQRKIDDKSNEITAIPELLKQLEIQGCIVTIDAMGTQTKIAKTIVEQKADYILTVKENQKKLYEDISLYLKKDVMTKSKIELEKQGNYYKEYTKEHGRIEKREYYIEKDITWLEQRKEWAKLNGIGVCVSTVTKGNETTTYSHYAIFSRENMTAETFGKAKRTHWKIENSLHWILDIAFREDESRVRSGNAAENLNVLRHLTLNMLKQEKSCKRGIAGKRKNCGWDNNYLLKVLNTVKIEEES